MAFYTSQRLSLKGHLCTVRFIGSVQGKSGEWLGVEWDDPARGKHNGTFEGVKYFECKSAALVVSIHDHSRITAFLSSHLRQKQVVYRRLVSEAQAGMGRTKEFLSSPTCEIHV